MTYTQYMALVTDTDVGNKTCNDIMTAVKNNDIAAIVTHIGGAAALSRRLNLPYTTVQQWLYGKRKPPEYTIQLIGFALINDF